MMMIALIDRDYRRQEAVGAWTGRSESVSRRVIYGRDEKFFVIYLNVRALALLREE